LAGSKAVADATASIRWVSGNRQSILYQVVSISELRDLVRTLNYVVTHHAADELEDDNLTIFDLENIVLTGRIIERQHDDKTGESKYLIIGDTVEGYEAETIVKIGFAGTLIFITVYVV
jgi:hypothetical protein